MKFRIFVGACLGLMTYGVLYSNLPCWAQLLDKTFYCQVQAGFDEENAAQAALNKLPPAEQNRVRQLARERQAKADNAAIDESLKQLELEVPGFKATPRRGQ